MSSDFQETLSVSVSDDVTAVSVGPGGPDTPTEDLAAKRKEQELEYLRRYVAPHNTPSRLVTEEDIPRALEDAKVMLNLCHIPRGATGGAFAIAHTQIEDKDPLRFFVTEDGRMIVNPIIENPTNYYKDCEEGCMTYPGEPKIPVQRFHKIDMRFQAIIKNKDNPDKLELSEAVTETLSGTLAQVCQHEAAHLNGMSIYNKDHVPESCLGVVSREDVDKDEKLI
jgi:peptide deformylase